MAFQNITATRLGQDEATTAYTLLYKTPANTRTIVKSFDVCNTTTGTRNFSISLVPVGGTAGASNALFYEFDISSHTVVQWSGTQVLNAGEMIYIKASAAGVTIRSSGGEGS